MLSKLLKDEVDGIQPLILRDRPRAPLSKDAQEQENAVNEEVARLRTAISNLTIQSSEQAKQAYETGLRAGAEQMRQRMEGEVRGMVEKLGAAMTEVVDTRGAVLHRAEADTVRLAVEIARRVLHRELTTDVSALEALIKAALLKLQTQEVYRVRVHPDQQELLKNCLEESGRSQGVTVVGDPLQARGGAVFEISGGALDASVETQLREIERGLMDKLEARA